VIVGDSRMSHPQSSENDLFSSWPPKGGFPGDGCFLNTEKFVRGLISPASAPFLEGKGAIMVLVVSSWYSGVVRHLTKKCGLFCRVVYRIVFRETDVTIQDPSNPMPHSLCMD